MGSIYQRSQWLCATCNKRLDKTVDRAACTAAGHAVTKRTSDILWIKYSRGGKSYAESSDSDLKGVAKALLQLREGDIQRGEPVTPRMGKITFDEAAENMLAEY